MINTVHPDGGFHKWGYPNSWSVYSGKSQSKMDYSSNGCTPTWIVNDEWMMTGGTPHFMNHPFVVRSETLLLGGAPKDS